MIGERNDEIIRQVIASYTRQNEDLVKTLITFQYWFRGAMNRDDAWALSPIEREMAITFINDRFKEAGDLIKKDIPVFL